MNRTDDGLIIECWTDVAQHLAGGRDLTEWARSCGAFERSRRIGDGETLLRLALAYGCCGLSLRQAALWAAGDGIATLSDEALYKRLAKTGAWLGEIATGLLGGRTGGDKRRLRVVDGTTVTAPGSDRPNWRLILDFDPDAQRLCGLSLSPAKQGESLGRCSLDPGDLAIADRGFARPDGLAAIQGQGADFLVRLGQRSLRLYDTEQNRITLDKLLPAVGPEGIDQPVFVGRTGAPPLQARLVAIPLPQPAAERNRRKLQRAGQQEGYTPSQAARVTAGYLVLLTSLSEEDVPASS
ncbi:MAG: transposase, partial [Verrucomicrobiae bacterium]|nr:transposase [Verrucomicrobiae bacterium]